MKKIVTGIFLIILCLCVYSYGPPKAFAATGNVAIPTLDMGNNISLPDNNTIPNNININNPDNQQSDNGVMNLWTYALIAIGYIMIVHFAINMGSEFSLGMMIAFFIVGAAIGGWLHTYESGFVGAAVLSLLFIGGPKKEM